MGIFQPLQLYSHKQRRRESNLWPSKNLGCCLPCTFLLVILPLNACFGRGHTPLLRELLGVFGKISFFTSFKLGGLGFLSNARQKGCDRRSKARHVSLSLCEKDRLISNVWTLSPDRSALTAQCTVTCGQGLRYRVVLCIDHRGLHAGGCNPTTKPHIKEECLVTVPCYKSIGELH